jgi:hypothetical protein
MHFISGLIGVEQDAQTLAVRPCIGWAVADAVADPEAAKARDRHALRRLERDLADAGFPLVADQRLEERIVAMQLHRSVVYDCLENLGYRFDKLMATWVHKPHHADD